MSDPHEVIGRAPELEIVERFLDRVDDGVSVLLFKGDAGMGKTVLWQLAVSAARDRGWTVLSSRPTASETRLSYAALGDLVSDVGAERLDAMPTLQRSALDAALLRASKTPVDQLAVSIGFVGLLTTSAGEGLPVIVAVDDLHWVDVPTARVLEFAVRRAADRGVLFVFAVRTGEPSTVVDALLRLLPEPSTKIVDVAPLSLGALHRLFISRFGHQFSRPVLVRIERASGGNPLAALEIARALLESDEALTPGAPLPVSREIRQLLGRRIARLPRQTRDALLVIAGLATPDLDGVARAAGVGDIEPILAPAIAEGIVEEDRGSIRFAHPLMASVVYGATSASRRRELHGRLAKVTDDLEERARHLALSTTTADASIAAALEEAGTHARQRGAPDTAAELLELARSLTPSNDQATRTRRLLAAGEALFEAADTGGARRLLEHETASMPHGPDRARGLLLLATIRWYDNVEAAASLAAAALADAAGDPTLQGRIHSRLALFSPDHEERMNHSAAAVRLIDPDEDPSLLAFALFGWFYAQVLDASVVRMDLLERALALEPDFPTWEVSTIPALWWKYTDDYERARERLHRHLQWARETGDASSDADTLAHLAELELWAGDWVLAERYADASVDAAEQMGEPPESASHRIQALVRAHVGRTIEARTAAAAGHAAAAAGNDPILAAMYHTAAGFAALTDDDPQAADRSFTELQRDLARIGMREPIRFRSEGDHIEALVALGALERAEEILATLAARHRFLPRPWTAVVTPRSRALISAARGDLDTALAEAQAAVEASASLASPFEVARTLLVHGQVLRRANRRRAAADTLGQALAIFERLPAPLWARRAREEAARLGLRRDAGRALTPSEREVARLAAAGMTNRQVAEALFISPKTVEANLGRAYSKLGIHSRAELGRVMADEPSHERGVAPTDS